jgi:hypothetical protein
MYDDEKEMREEYVQKFVEKLPNLRALKMVSSPGTLDLAFEQQRLDTISWNITRENIDRGTHWECRGKEYHFSIPNENLKSLKLNWIKSGNFELIPSLYPNLETLDLDFFDPDFELTEDCFRGLNRLKYFFLESAEIRDSTIRILLNSCPKLRDVRLIDCEQISSQIIGDFEAYAKNHPKRVVNLCLSLDFDGKEREMRETRVEANFKLNLGGKDIV